MPEEERDWEVGERGLRVRALRVKGEGEVEVCWERECRTEPPCWPVAPKMVMRLGILVVRFGFE